jgi:hypothetical protein
MVRVFMKIMNLNHNLERSLFKWQVNSQKLAKNTDQLKFESEPEEIAELT